MNCQLAEDLINNVDDKLATDYRAYWKTLIPTTANEVFWRTCYAILTVQISWQQSKEYFNMALSHFDVWANGSAPLHNLFSKVKKAGLAPTKSRFLYELREKVGADPTCILREENEDWFDYRARLASNVKGISLAKAGFVVEMCAPLEGNAVCLDVHMLRLYGRKLLGKPADHVKDHEYLRYEKHWIDTCNKKGIEPCLARHIVWDKLHGSTDSKYWADVLKSDKLKSEKAILV